jgi:glucose-1-phosphate cytidylyltransferase
MKTIILAGGAGSRLSEETGVKPKPMLEIGEYPILWHILQIYSRHGFQEFLIALGYKGEVIKDYFLNFYARNADVTVRLGRGDNEVHATSPPAWTVHLIDTGIRTQTGGRMRRLTSWLEGEKMFMMTYGDGVANIDIQRLIAFHCSHRKLATVTAVRPPARFGSLRLDDTDRVVGFAEKPQAGEGWINGGFFVLEREVLDLIAGDDTLWEHEPMETLAKEGELMAYRHEGFWQPMDTLREKRLLEELWASGKAPWKSWT